jgi:GT2 family glycosyltransferase
MGEKIGIILVVTNEKHHLELLFGSLARQTYRNFSIYFVDNNSSDGSMDYSKQINAEHPLDIHYIQLNENSGFAKGNNTGADAAMNDGCEYVFVLNPDMELSENTLDVMLKTCQSSPKTGVCSAVLLFGCEKRNNLEIQIYGGKANFKTQKKEFLYSNQKLQECILPDLLKVDFVNGGSTFIRKELIKECGLFEEKYFIYNDEIDLGYRVKKAGYDTVVTSGTRIWHHHNWASRNSEGYRRMYYYMMRNKFLYHKKFHHYAYFIYDILKSVIQVPVTLRWLMKTSDARLVKLYYLGMLRGILGETGKRKGDF